MLVNSTIANAAQDEEDIITPMLKEAKKYFKEPKKSVFGGYKANGDDKGLFSLEDFKSKREMDNLMEKDPGLKTDYSYSYKVFAMVLKKHSKDYPTIIDKLMNFDGLRNMIIVKAKSKDRCFPFIEYYVQLVIENDAIKDTLDSKLEEILIKHNQSYLYGFLYMLKLFSLPHSSDTDTASHSQRVYL